jgi:hypothetical protein
LFIVESHYFWKRVAEVRMLTGAANSFQVGETVARKPKIIIMGLLGICIKYSIAVYIFLRGVRQFILTRLSITLQMPAPSRYGVATGSCVLWAASW